MKLGLLIKLIFVFLFLPKISFADSPLTSTPFHNAYMDKNIVLKAEAIKIMNKEIADYLHSPSNPIDVKAAVINALGWDVDGKNNYVLYCQLIFNRLMIEGDIVNLNLSDAFTIGYLLAMDDYNKPEDALPYLKKARELDDNSFTINIIYNLVRAQKVMGKDFCKVWKYTEKVFSNKNLTEDMRDDAVKIIYDYMGLYKKNCK